MIEFKRSGFFVISDKETSNKQKFKEFIIPFLLCLLSMSIVFAFIFFTKIPSKLLLESKDVYGEKSDPSLSRLILMIVDIFIVIGCLILSRKYNIKDRIYITTFISYLGGTFLWQLLGECTWHFGFFRIEVAPAIPIALLLTILLMYIYRKNTFPWYLLIFIIAFMSNWIGHLVEIGPAQLLQNVLPIKTSYIIFGSIFGGLFLLYCIYRFIFNAVNLKARIITSMGIFISICVIMFAFMES